MLTGELEARASGMTTANREKSVESPRPLHLRPDSQAFRRVVLGQGLSCAQENGETTRNLTFIHEVPCVEEKPMAILMAGLQGECRCDLVL